jgi:hypothetical protein
LPRRSTTASTPSGSARIIPGAPSPRISTSCPRACSSHRKAGTGTPT